MLEAIINIHNLFM